MEVPEVFFSLPSSLFVYSRSGSWTSVFGVGRWRKTSRRFDCKTRGRQTKNTDEESNVEVTLSFSK